jgi:N-acetylneuraminic acid mutarotase
MHLLICFVKKTMSIRRVVFYFMAFLISGCTKNGTSTSTLAGNWVRRSDFEGKARTEAVASVASDGKVYTGLGFDGTNRLTDFWEYDATQDWWIPKDSFPGTARNSAVSFAAAGKVYVGLGFDGVNYLKDFWQYDPSTDKWTQLADFPGSARYGAVAFSIGDKGYICSGYDGNYLKDFWQYDPATDAWIKKISPGGSKRNEAVVFVINNKAYLCTGVNNGDYVNDMFVYDPASETWTEERKLTNVSDQGYDDLYTTIVRTNAVAFSLNGKGYITTGLSSSYLNNTWEYDPGTDQWTEKTAFEGTGRDGAIGFSVNNRAFVGLGKSASLRFDDLREFLPDATYNQND